MSFRVAQGAVRRPQPGLSSKIALVCLRNPDYRRSTLFSSHFDLVRTLIPTSFFFSLSPSSVAFLLSFPHLYLFVSLVTAAPCVFNGNTPTCGLYLCYVLNLSCKNAQLQPAPLCPPQPERMVGLPTWPTRTPASNRSRATPSPTSSPTRTTSPSIHLRT
ncbi:hypothetical protein B0H19DRAFT_1385815 [Mycena capillaripes]|nr:hypothetical protein B0H19DRAFT_1385815 [Mycena capillaripes]